MGTCAACYQSTIDAEHNELDAIAVWSVLASIREVRVLTC